MGNRARNQRTTTNNATPPKCSSREPHDLPRVVGEQPHACQTEVGENGNIEKGAQRRADTEDVVDAREHPSGVEGGSAQFEEVVLRPDGFDGENLGPDACQFLFRGGRGKRVRARRTGAGFPEGRLDGVVIAHIDD